MKKLFTIAFVLCSISMFAQDVKYYNKNGVAIDGYDVVAYFSDNMAAKGSKNFTYEWQGSKWMFKSQANLDKFKMMPEKYAPQFGGYCAYGASENHKAPTEPAAFTIVDEKLYLNYNNQVRDMWRKDTKARIEKANMNWPTLKDSKEM